MEKIEILKFIKSIANNGYGYGSGSGSGSGDGSGDGYGYGYGSGAGYGADYGSGAGSGSGSGDGSGHGSDYGAGHGADYGYGAGSGDGIICINNINLYLIDGLLTGIIKVKNNIAKGFILNNDFSTEKCYVVKNNKYFAHGKTLKEAMSGLLKKTFNNMTESERIELFLNEFELNIKYPAMLFFDWHNKLTGSCEMGRKLFAKNNEIDLENDMYTVYEFIEKTKNDYGSNIIIKLENRIKDLNR